MIEQHMKQNKKYDFLRHDDNPYRPYYIQELDIQIEKIRLREKKDGNDEVDERRPGGDDPEGAGSGDQKEK